MKHDPWSRKRSLYSASAVKNSAKPKMKFRILPILWLAFKRASTVIGAFVLIISFLTVWSLSSVTPAPVKTTLPDEMVLFLTLDGDLADVPSQGSVFVDPFSPQPLSMREFTYALSKAKDDPRVKGVLASMEYGGYAVAHMQEMRAAIKDFRQSGKFAYVYAPSFSEAGNLGAYYLAAAFDEIWMQPMGMVGIMGLNAEMPYFRGVLDKIGVSPQFFQRKEYKTAYESFTNSGISPENREMMEELINDFADVLSVEIAQDRNMSSEKFKSLVGKGLFLDEEAKKEGLIDVLGYGNELIAKVNEAVTGDPDDEDLMYVYIEDYASSFKPKENFAKEMLEGATAKSSTHKNKDSGDEDRYGTDVALIYASGAIVSSNDGNADGVAAADDISSALQDAAEDDSIGVVVLRIDSPGGSPVASETILHAARLVQEADKKVIVSMGPAAASGGYWIAANADRIFVLPTTITGSIGVLGGKFSAKELWTQLGVQWDRVSWGQNSGMWSMNTPFSASEAERMEAMLDNVYQSFVARVAAGRKMSAEQVEKIARGRVWTGGRAVENGLADEIGGLDQALDYAAAQVGAKDRHDVNVVVMPKPLTSFERFIQMLEGQVMAGQMIGSQAKVLEALSPVLRDVMMAQNPQNHMVYNPLQVK